WRPAMALASVSSRMSLTRSPIAAGRCSYSSCAMKRASSLVGSLKFCTGVLDCLRPLADLGLDQRREFLGRGDRRLGREADQLVAHVGLLVDLRHGGVDLVDDRRRDPG